MEGGVTGLDWVAALAALPSGLNLNRAKQLLASAEAGYVPAWWDYAKSQLPNKSKG